MPKLVPLKEASEQLKINRVTLWRGCRDGTLPATQIGRRWYIDLDGLPLFMADQARRRAERKAQARPARAKGVGDDC